MLVSNTNMHVVVAIITSFELVMLLIQAIYYLQRPSEKGRLWFLLLLIFLIQYNLAGSILPDKRLGIPIHYQFVYTYTTGVVMSLYVLYYLYKVFDLTKLRFFTIKSITYCIVCPFLFLFVIPYLITGNFTLFNKLVCVIPTVYGIVIAWLIYRSLIEKYNLIKQDGDKGELIEQMVTVFLAYVFWISMPIVTYFEGSQILEHSLTNFGFLIMTISYVKSIIVKSHKEHEELKLSQKLLRGMNEELIQKVKDRTLQIELLYEERYNNYVNFLHETKTPLTLMKNYIDEYVSKHAESVELNVVRNNIDKLSHSISNIFDTERLIKGLEIYNHNQIANFSQILKDNTFLFRPFFQKKSIEVEEEVDNDVYIQADPNAVNSIVNNILENAIKFSDQNGRVQIFLSTFKGQITFSVHDEGIGITPKLQNKVFEPYFQINTDKKNFQGMGLGLPIIKKIVDSLDGQVIIESDPLIKKGTLIKVILNKYQLSDIDDEVPRYPVQKNESLDTFDFNIVARSHDPDKFSILIVEDKKAMLWYLHQKFSEKYNIEYAINGKEGLKCLRKSTVRFDLIITDIMMDEMDGFDFAKVVVELNEYRHIPIIFLSAKTTRQDKLKALKLGAVDFIQKPFSYTELAYKIESIFKNVTNQKKATHNDIISSVKRLGTQDVLLLERKIIEKRNSNYKLYNLTPREIEIVNMVRDGLTYPKIAKTILRAESTVKKHIENTFNKCGVHSQDELLQILDN